MSRLNDPENFRGRVNYAAHVIAYGRRPTRAFDERRWQPWKRRGRSSRNAEIPMSRHSDRFPQSDLRRFPCRPTDSDRARSSMPQA